MRSKDKIIRFPRAKKFFLESVQMERFKAAFQPEPLSLCPFTLIIGRNGSGKNTVLEALQWLDVAMREDAVRACHRYSGIHDLLNIRSRGENTRYFKLTLHWATGTNGELDGPKARYELRVNESMDGRPLIHSQSLMVTDENHHEVSVITTEEKGNRHSHGRRLLTPRLTPLPLSPRTPQSPARVTIHSCRYQSESFSTLRFSPASR
jgi:energy-coupling factor transporter ATP-binding protein EcfA2